MDFYQLLKVPRLEAQDLTSLHILLSQAQLPFARNFLLHFSSTCRL